MYYFPMQVTWLLLPHTASYNLKKRQGSVVQQWHHSLTITIKYWRRCVSYIDSVWKLRSEFSAILPKLKLKSISYFSLFCWSKMYQFKIVIASLWSIKELLFWVFSPLWEYQCGARKQQISTYVHLHNHYKSLEPLLTVYEPRRGLQSCCRRWSSRNILSWLMSCKNIRICLSSLSFLPSCTK